MGNARGSVAVAINSIGLGARGLADQVRGVAGIPPKGLTSGELRLSSGEPHVLLYEVSWSDRSWQYACEAARSFVPTEGMHYQM